MGPLYLFSQNWNSNFYFHIISTHFILFFSLIRFRTIRYCTKPYYSIRRWPIGLVLAQIVLLDPFFTKLKLKFLFSHNIYSFHTFCFPWYGSELCASVQIHTILYNVGQLGSFLPKWERKIRFFTKLKLKLLFSNQLYSFHTFGFPWSGSELCATVQIQIILYDVGRLDSFWQIGRASCRERV